MSEIVVGKVSGIRRYPVKSMLGEALEVVALDQRGVVGDRLYALVDQETGKVVSVKRPRRWGRMFELAGITLDDGRAAVSFPDGETVAVGDSKLPIRLGEFFGRAVSVADTPPADARFDEIWVRELKGGAEPYFGMESRVEDDEEMIDGGAFMGPQGNFFNFGAVHLVTTVPRCVMTTLPQGDLPADRDVLRTIAETNSIDVLQTGTPYPCVGVYADVLAEGEIRRGDPVRLIE